MIKCHICGSAMESRHENHRYTESGLSNVTIVDMEVRHCSNCGEREYVFPRIAQLHRLLAFMTAGQPFSLIGEQIRFLRKYLGWSRDQFASIMGVQTETISRWENDRATMSKSADRLLRLCIFRMEPIREYPAEKLAEVGQPGKPEMFRVASTPKGWDEASEVAAQ